MADISTITLPSNNTYNLKDAASVHTLVYGSNSYNPTSNSLDITTLLDSVISQAIVGSASFRGTVSAQSTISDSNYKKGWYWVVATAGTYVGKSCEIGDFIFAIADKGNAYSASDFSVVQANIDMSIFKALAFKDSATTLYTPSGSVSLTNTNKTATVSSTSGTATYTPAGSVTLSGSKSTVTPAASGDATYTPAGQVLIVGGKSTVTTTTGSPTYTPGGTVSLSGAASTVSKAASGTATYTPQGSVTAPTISLSVAGGVDTIHNPTAVKMVKGLNATAPGSTPPAAAITYYAVSGENLKLYQLSCTTADSITTTDVVVKTGD